MDIHYNAFISYRHHPEDIRVATEIHRALEHYRIPKAVRKNQKGSMRLFRDKDELPITSNLSDDIFRALENSDFLIVICSTHTKESLWVQREIETFLKTHSYDKVLTVLVDGEPYDTIPEILQFREEVDPDTGEVKRVPIEPLSCDWRVGKKAAHREELPRLAAALLHCGYDELRQRQRQYKMRRMVTFFSVALVASVSLMAYFLYTSIKIQRANEDLQAANEEIRKANVEIQEANVQVQKNLSAALRNQSEYLASAASERYEAGDRLTAISLAMAALPTDEADRPYVPGAEQILSEALGLYTTERDIVASGIMDCGAIIDAFDVTEDGKIMYTVDRNGRITSWDADKYVKLATVDMGNSSYYRMNVVGQNLLIQLITDYYTDDPELCCYSGTGELLWSVDECVDYAVLGEDTIMVLYYPIASDVSVIDFLNAVTGEPCRESFEVPVSGQISPDKFYQDVYTPGQPIAIAYSDWTLDYIYLIDLEKEKIEVMEPYSLWKEDQISSLSILGTAVTQQGDVLVMASDGSGKYNGVFNGMVTTSPANAILLCYEKDSLNLRWRQEITTYSYNTICTLATIPETDQILCQNDNMFLILDLKTGEIVSQCETMANILSVYVETDKAYGVMEDGCYYSYIYEDNQCTALRLLDSDIAQAKIAHGYFTLQVNSNYVTEYTRSSENGWTPYPESPESFIRWSHKCGNQIVILTSDKHLSLFDVSTGTILWSTLLESGYNVDFLGLSEDGKSLYIKEYANVITLDMATGEAKIAEIPVSANEANFTMYGFSCMANDTLYYQVFSGNDFFLAAMDLKTGDAVFTPLQPQTGDEKWTSTSESGPVTANGEYVWLWNGNDLIEFSVGKGSSRVVVPDLSEYPLCLLDAEEDLLCVGTAGKLMLVKPGGNQVLCLDLEGLKAASVCFYKNEILVITSDAYLTRFDWEGNRLSKMELTVYTSFYSACTPTGGKIPNIHWDFTGDGELVLDIFGLGNIVDCTEWGVRAYILNYNAFDHRGNRIICYSDYTLGYFPRYTTDEVVAVALDQLNGYQLPEETKNYYGID